MYFSKLILVPFSLATFLSCSTTKTTHGETKKMAKSSQQKVEVIKDCTGMYLRVEGKDWQVCNEVMLKDYKSGDHITATFAKTETCPEFDGERAVCMMYHPKEGMIRISKIE